MSGLFITVLILVVVVELALSAGWNRFYFRRGLPVFRRHLPRIDVARISSRWLLQQHRHAGPLPLTFKRLFDDEIAFREGIGVLHYTPVMHGVLRNHRSGKGAMVVGYLHWSTAFLLVGTVTRDVLNVLQGRLEMPVSLLLMLFVAMLYGFQAARFYRMGNLIGGHISHVSKASLKAQYDDVFGHHDRSDVVAATVPDGAEASEGGAAPPGTGSDGNGVGSGRA